MRSTPNNLSLVHGTGYAQPVWLRIVLSHGDETIYRNCHFWSMSNENNLDLYSADSMKMIRVARYNDVLLVEEVDAPPADDVPPVEQPPDVIEATAGSINVEAVPKVEDKDDDLPF